MFSEVKVTEIYCMADDFCKEFTLLQKKYMVEDKAYPHRNKPHRMNDAENGYPHPVPFERIQMFQALLQGICLQALGVASMGERNA